MSDNVIAKALRGIGIGIIILGILAFLIVWNEGESMVVGIGGIVGSVIFGVLFIGFSEVVDLLQHSLDKQIQILKTLQEKPKVIKEVVEEKPVSEVEDIESNLPQL